MKQAVLKIVSHLLVTILETALKARPRPACLEVGVLERNALEQVVLEPAAGPEGLVEGAPVAAQQHRAVPRRVDVRGPDMSWNLGSRGSESLESSNSRC